MDDNKIEIKLDEENGNLTINIFEYIKNLPDEKKEELMWDGGWWNFVEDDLVERIIKSFSREHYNPKYHQFRTKIINGDAMPKLIHSWAETMIVEREYHKQRAECWLDAYGKLFSWAHKLLDAYNSGYRYEFQMPKFPDSHYSSPYPKEMIDEANAMIEEWKSLFPEPEQDD